MSSTDLSDDLLAVSEYSCHAQTFSHPLVMFLPMAELTSGPANRWQSYGKSIIQLVSALQRHGYIVVLTTDYANKVNEMFGKWMVLSHRTNMDIATEDQTDLILLSSQVQQLLDLSASSENLCRTVALDDGVAIVRSASWSVHLSLTNGLWTLGRETNSQMLSNYPFPLVMNFPMTKERMGWPEELRPVGKDIIIRALQLQDKFMIPTIDKGTMGVIQNLTHQRLENDDVYELQQELNMLAVQLDVALKVLSRFDSVQQINQSNVVLWKGSQEWHVFHSDPALQGLDGLGKQVWVIHTY